MYSPVELDTESQMALHHSIEFLVARFRANE